MKRTYERTMFIEDLTKATFRNSHIDMFLF